MSDFMKNMKNKFILILNNIDINKLTLIVIISIIAAIVNILPVLSTSFNTPEGYTYLWTGHYYLDYFTYLQAITQGIRGRWLVENPFATDDPSVLFAWWPYLILGKIAKILGLSAVSIYWISVFLASVVFALITYLLISKLLDNKKFIFKLGSFLIFLFATPFFAIHSFLQEKSLQTYDYWYAPNIIFRRFGNVPYHIISSIILLITLLCAANIISKIDSGISKQQLIRKSIYLSLLMIILLSFSPFAVITILITLFAVLLIKSTRVVYKVRKAEKIVNFFLVFLVQLILVVPFALVIKLVYGEAQIFARASAWEITQNVYTSPIQLLLILGPVVSFSFLIFFDIIKRPTNLKITALTFIIVSFVLFYSPTAYILKSHNWRFISPALYSLSAPLAVLGLLRLFKFLKITSKGILILIIILLIFSIPINFKFLSNQMRDTNLTTNISFVSNDLIEGFERLDSQKGTGAVLTAPNQYMGLLVPVFTNKKVFLARDISTPEFYKKAEQANIFFSGGLDYASAYDFIKNHGIDYIFLTDQDNIQDTFTKEYTFISKIVESNTYAIYKTN